MANVRGLFGSQSYEAGIKKLDVRDMIFELQPDAAPFVSVMKEISKAKAVDTTINWFEDDLLANYTQTSAAVASTTLTTIPLDATGHLQEGDIVKDLSTSEVMRVVSVNDTALTIEVVRGWGATAAQNIGLDDYIYKLGSAMVEGWSSPESLVTAKTKVFNYLQIFSKTVMITETADNIDVYGGNRRDFERRKKGVELKRDMESQFLFGEPKEDTTGAQKRWQTGGVWYFLKGTAPELDMNNAALTESAWEGFLKDAFQYGSSTKLFFAGPLILSQISGFAASKQRIDSGVTIKYGVKVTSYHSAVGDVDMIRDDHFVGPFAGYGFLLDIEELVYRYLQNMDIQLKLNLQAKKDHYIIDEYYGQIGLEIHNAKKHGLLYDVGTA